MTHIAIAEALDGKVVDWLEHVSDAQYRLIPAQAEVRGISNSIEKVVVSTGAIRDWAKLRTTWPGMSALGQKQTTAISFLAAV